jgi:cupin 2 domain-containing protein
MPIRTGNFFADIPCDQERELFDELLASGSLKVERIVSRGHSSPEQGWYDQENNEWVMILEGWAILLIEGEGEFRLERGDYLNIPAHARHKVTWTDLEHTTLWLAIHY